jgi:hypothetical protein
VKNLYMKTENVTDDDVFRSICCAYLRPIFFVWRRYDSQPMRKSNTSTNYTFSSGKLSHPSVASVGITRVYTSCLRNLFQDQILKIMNLLKLKYRVSQN